MTTPQSGNGETPDPANPLSAPPAPMGNQIPPPGYGQYGYYPMPPVRPTEPMALVSMIMSIMGVTTCGVTSLIGAVLGHSALRRIRANPGAFEGEGMAKAGVIIGWVLVGCFALGALAYFGFLAFVIYMGTSQGWD